MDIALFALTLLGVAVFHRRTLEVALLGLGAIVTYEVGWGRFREGSGWQGLVSHLEHEWVVLANLLCLLLGFALLARHFEDSRVPAVLPRVLPRDWRGGFLLLLAVAVLSSFLDNIAAALIGGAVAHTVFRGRVHIGYVAAIVAAANAGGAGSVVGDTTTTMMWIDGVSPLAVLHAYAGSAVAVLVFGIPAALQQHRHSPIANDRAAHVPIDWPRIAVVAFVLVTAIAVNVAANLYYADVVRRFPVIGVAVVLALLITAPVRRPEWTLLPGAFRGSVFLLALVLGASMMPVEELPSPSWQTAFGLGFVSAVFDNIPLTALALTQGGYDWGVLAYAVGFGGSMIWFGSSAGVAISGMYPEAKSAAAWLKNGWHVAVAYVLGFVVMLLTLGWRPG